MSKVKINPIAGMSYWDGKDMLSVQSRETMSEHATVKHGIRAGSEYVTYKIKRHPGMTFYQSVSGFVRRISKAQEGGA